MRNYLKNEVESYELTSALIFRGEYTNNIAEITENQQASVSTLFALP